MRASRLTLVSWLLVQVLAACAGWPVVRNLCHRLADWQKGQLHAQWIWMPNSTVIPSATPQEVVVNHRRYDVIQAFASAKGLRLLVQADALESLLDVAAGKPLCGFVPIALLAGACPNPPIHLNPKSTEVLLQPSASLPHWVNPANIPPVRPPKA